MGYPASAALLFKALTEEDDRWLHREAKNIISKFSLFAIILADPVKDPSFYKQLQLNFSFYDRLTGGNFLFFSIIKEADSEIFDGAHKRYKIFNDPEAYKQDHAAEETKHSELVIHAICSILGVNYDDTPCLIISNDLRFGQFCKINTDLNSLEKQLKELSRVADYLSKNPISKSLSGLLTKFNELGNFFSSLEYLEINPSVIRSVSEILQAVSHEGIFSDHSVDNLGQKFLDENLSKDRIDEVNSLLSTFRRDRRRPDFESMEFKDRADMEFEDRAELSEPFISYMKTDNQQKPNSIIKLITDQWNNVQFSTKNYLKVASLLHDQNWRLFKYTNDFSTYSFPLCKSFEAEINLSIVQLMRKKLGIPMPPFFFKYYPNIGNLPVRPLDSLVQQPREIYLNNQKYGKWLPPGLGESRLLFITLRNETPDLGIDWQTEEKLQLLIANWEAIQKVRNITMHSEPVSRKHKLILENAFETLHENGLLNGLTSLKNSLRN